MSINLLLRVYTHTKPNHCLWGGDIVDKDKEDKEMATQNQDTPKTQKTTTANNDAVMNIAKKGMGKYRKMLDKLAKN